MKTSSSRPRVGVNLDNKPAFREFPEYAYIATDYIDVIVRSGAIPVLLPPVDDLSLVSDMLETLDGCLFIGGADLDPRNDGYKLHSSVCPMTKRRELFDRALMNEVSRRRMPVMGVGAGMQLLNVSQGGALFLHIQEDLPNALPHRDAHSDYSLRHRILIKEDSLLYSVYGDNEVRVNSRHHMAIDDVAPGFIVTARCPGLSDGRPASDANVSRDDWVIEAIESNLEDWFAFGVQFHPEAGQSATDLDRNIFSEFVKGISIYKETGRNMLLMKPHTKEYNRKTKKTRNSETTTERISKL